MSVLTHAHSCAIHRHTHTHTRTHTRTRIHVRARTQSSAGRFADQEGWTVCQDCAVNAPACAQRNTSVRRKRRSDTFHTRRRESTLQRTIKRLASRNALSSSDLSTLKLRNTSSPLQCRCPAGEFSEEAATACEDCEKGKALDIVNGNPGCALCAPGTYANADGMPECLPCGTSSSILHTSQFVSFSFLSFILHVRHCARSRGDVRKHHGKYDLP